MTKKPKKRTRKKSFADTKRRLWAKASGRCQYRGCGKILYKDEVTHIEFNSSYIAHIIAQSEGGPRYVKGESELLKEDLSNLMLLCDPHHRLIDIIDVEGHPRDRLEAMKEENERRIELVSGMMNNHETSVVVYTAKIRDHSPRISKDEIDFALYRSGKYYDPKHKTYLGLGATSLSELKDGEVFWHYEQLSLKEKFYRHIENEFGMQRGIALPVAVFAIAPMPLLIQLGVLLSDLQKITVYENQGVTVVDHDDEEQPDGGNLSPIREIDIYQLQREPLDQRWQWFDSQDVGSIEFEIILPEPKKEVHAVAVSVEFSFNIEPTRIYKVLDKDVALWRIKVRKPNPSLIKTPEQLEHVRQIFRETFENILQTHGDLDMLHVFPAMSVSASVEFGRCWMNKAQHPMTIYDEIKQNGGFQAALQIK